MSTRFAHSVSLSAAAHAAAILLAVMIASPLVRFEPPTISTEVFTLVSDDRPKMTNPVNEALAIKLPAIPQPTKRHTPPVVETRNPPPTPPATRPTAEAKSATSQITFDDYQTRILPKQHSSPRAPVVIAPPIKIEAPVFTPEAQNLSASSDTGSDDAFIAQLIHRLRNAYVSVGQDDQSLACLIEFTLRPDGRMQSSRIIASSGNTIFDDAVLAALKRVGAGTPPASLVGAPIRATFKMRP